MFVSEKGKGYILLSPLCSLCKVRFLFQLVPPSIPSDLPNIRTLLTYQALSRLPVRTIWNITVQNVTYYYLIPYDAT